MTAAFSLPDYFQGREGARRRFADAHGYAGVPISLLYEDMASRRFYRLQGGEPCAVLMDSLPDSHSHATRGHSLHDYIRLSEALRARGVRAPKVYAADEENGFLLIEDFGDRKIEEGQLEQAVDVLIALGKAFDDNALQLPDYFHSHIHAGHRRIVDWYVPCVRREKNPDGWVEEYLALWQSIEARLPPPPCGFIHADFHRGNLMWTGDGVGVIDFQGAQWGPLAYDLVNLLEDARTAAPPQLKASLKARYAASLPEAQREPFAIWYDVLSAQFHCRVIGQFIKLALAGKTGYLAHIPLVQSYLKEELRHPLVAPVGRWLEEKGAGLDTPPDPQPLYIRSDAV